LQKNRNWLRRRGVVGQHHAPLDAILEHLFRFLRRLTPLAREQALALM
jgi:hypothetical protein